MLKLNKKIIYFLLGCIFFITLLLIIFTIYKNNYYLEINIPKDSKLILNKNDDTSKLVYEFTQNGKYKVKKQPYTYTLQQNNQDFKEQKGTINITNKTNYLKIENSDYSDNKLKLLYQQEIDKINQALLAKYPEQMKTYSLKYGKLYKMGDWFGGKLTIEGPDYNDRFQVILHKENNDWKVMTTPSLSLSKDIYPDIPANILEEINIINRDENMDH